MTETLKKAGSIFYFLPLLLLIIFSLVIPSSLAASGSGEFSEGYKENLRVLFEEVIIKVDSVEMSGIEAKADLALLRSRYRVEYNDFAGKIDAVIDEVEENKKGYLEALNDFTIMQNNLIKARELAQKENFDKALGNEQPVPLEGPSPGRGGTSPRKKD